MGSATKDDPFNRAVKRICASHPELHRDCGVCGDPCCLYWLEDDDMANDPLYLCPGCRPHL